ncbi:hypothetical protein [Streptomyces broussonetiae]|uniref:hypothetical protein n=1 Tax=Streptomyces broussonetiae TaxID=2686304 RepID=UPI001E40A09E|nr:hypothetical protein [Streptomyces broussonetiae]
MIGGELPGLLDVIGDQRRRDGKAELGGELELGGLEVGSRNRTGVVDVGCAVQVVQDAAEPVAALGGTEVALLGGQLLVAGGAGGGAAVVHRRHLPQLVQRGDDPVGQDGMRERPSRSC